MPVIKLERSYLSDNSCVIGKLTLPDGFTCFTMERPWLNNLPSVSCIPAGLYTLGIRGSSIVQKTTKNEFFEGWEIQDVPGRSFIMLHPGNWASDSEGCILPGNDISFSSKGLMVTNSRKTFRELMKRLDFSDAWMLQISTFEGGVCGN